MHSQFPQYKDKISSVTNGVHISTWLSESFGELFDKYKDSLGDFRNNPAVLKNADNLRHNQQFRMDLWKAHQFNKGRLAEIFSHWRIKENVLTLCWARRIAQYKRPSLIIQDPKRLLSIAKKAGGLQIIIAGKAHPADSLAGTYVEKIMNTIDELSKEFENLRIIMLENYDIFFGKLLTSCVDVWLNNPLPPFEASGTSGMKAILNGVVQLTTLDGWVKEVGNEQIGEVFGYQHKDGETMGSESALRLKEDSQSLYDALENLANLYYQTYNNGDINVQSQWIDLMINCICQSAFFNSHRMVGEYRQNMWRV
jgi:starch phosphorylase